MTWVRIDDRFNEHPKLARVGPLGQALWLVGLAYSNRNLTDGFIPWSIAATLMNWEFLDAQGPTRIYVGMRAPLGPSEVEGWFVDEEGAVTSGYVIRLLVEAGVWDKCDGGYLIHDFEDYQPTKAQVLAERARKVAAGTAGGVATAAARGAAKPRQTPQQNRSPNPSPYPVPIGSITPLPPLVDEQKMTPEEHHAAYIARMEAQTGVKL
jgi:hypothetical protein